MPDQNKALEVVPRRSLFGIDEHRRELSREVFDGHVASLDKHINDMEAQIAAAEDIETTIALWKELRQWKAEKAKLLGLYPRPGAGEEAPTKHITVYALNWDGNTAPALPYVQGNARNMDDDDEDEDTD